MKEDLIRALNAPISYEDAAQAIGITVVGIFAGLALLWLMVRLRSVDSAAFGSGAKAALGSARVFAAALPKRTVKAVPKRAKTPKLPKEKKQPVVRNWAWFLDQVEEAQEDREFTMMHPSRVSNPRGMKALKRHQRRWKRMAKAPGGLLDGLMVYIAPAKGYKQAFIRALCFERDDEVEPEVPTAIVETWLPKATVADQPVKWRCDTGGNVMHSPNAYMRLTLPPGDAGQRATRHEAVLLFGKRRLPDGGHHPRGAPRRRPGAPDHRRPGGRGGLLRGRGRQVQIPG